MSTFARASAFNINIDGWDVGKVGGYITNTFSQAVALDQDLGAWGPQFTRHSAAVLTSGTGFRRPSSAWAANASVLLHGGLPAPTALEGVVCGATPPPQPQSQSQSQPQPITPAPAPCTPAQFSVNAGTTYTIAGPLNNPGLDTSAAFTGFGGATYAATRFYVTVEPGTPDLTFYDAVTGTWVLQPLETHAKSSVPHARHEILARCCLRVPPEPTADVVGA